MSIIKLNNRGIRSATAVGTTTSLGDMVFIKKLTASSSATLSFVDGASSVVLDNTYKEYLFTFKNIHPETDDKHFHFNMSIDGGSNYNVTKTTTFHESYNKETGSDEGIQYNTYVDLAQSTDFQPLAYNVGGGNDETCSGILHLFNPSDTTFVKHFMSRFNAYNSGNYSVDQFAAGYGNTTSAVNAIQFKFVSGNIDAGDICLYGIN